MPSVMDGKPHLPCKVQIHSNLIGLILLPNGIQLLKLHQNWRRDPHLLRDPTFSGDASSHTHFPQCRTRFHLASGARVSETWCSFWLQVGNWWLQSLPSVTHVSGHVSFQMTTM